MGDAIVADVKLTLAALLEAVPESKREAPEPLGEPGPVPESDPINPSTAHRALAEVFPDDGIVVLDTSGSMKDEVGTTGLSRLDVAKQAVLASLPFFADEAAVGLWTFSRAESGADWVQVVPMGRLDRRLGAGTAREAEAMAVGWRPWRGYALLHLWTAAVFV